MNGKGALPRCRVLVGSLLCLCAMTQPLTQSLPNEYSRRLFRALRTGRYHALRAASLVDTPVQKLNGKSPYPPIHLRREVGPLAGFDTSATATIERMRTVAGLTNTSNFLDMGCGCGAVPIALKQFGSFDGEYIGLDVMRPLVEWCERRLADDKTKFAYFDYWSGTYNPSGQRFLAFPVEDGWSDVVLMKSVFTHMLPEDVAHYLKETRRVLAADGVAVLTAKLFTSVNPDIAACWPYVSDCGSYRFLRAASPESSIAYTTSWMETAMNNAGLKFSYTDGAAQGTMIVQYS